MARKEKFSIGELTFQGHSLKVGTPTVTVLARNAAGKVILCSGATIPTANDKGYAPGCIFIRTSHGTTYFNVSATTSAAFALQGVVTPGAITSAELATSAVYATRLADASIPVGKIGTAAVAKAKVKYIEATMAVASNAASLSVSSASFTSGVILGVRIANTVFTSNRTLQKVTLTASTAKVSLSGATTKTGANTYILTILRA